MKLKLKKMKMNKKERGEEKEKEKVFSRLVFSSHSRWAEVVSWKNQPESHFEAL